MGHVREEDVLDEVEREHKHCGVLVGQGAQDEPRVDGAGGGVKSDGAKESRDLTATARTRERTCPYAS